MRNPDCKVCGEMMSKGYNNLTMATTYSCRHCPKEPKHELQEGNKKAKNLQQSNTRGKDKKGSTR